MDSKKINESVYRSKLFKLCRDLNFLIIILVALTCICGYLIGTLIWWEWDA